MKFSMKKRALALACAASLAAALLTGCGPQQETPSSSGGETTDAIVLTDGTGREVTLSAPAERIVSACYPATATLIALGAAERVVGVEDGAAARELYRRAAPALQELPAVTGSDGVDTAAAAALEPDLVILPADQTEQAAAFDELGIPCVVLPLENIDDYWAAVTLLGTAAGAESRAADLIARQREVMERVTTLCAETEERPVVYLAGADFLTTPAGPMYQNSLISMCGGVCAGAEFSQTGWTKVTAEWLLGKDPDRIYMVSYADYTRDDILNEEQYRGLQAIKNNETAFLVFPSAIEPWDILAPSMALGTLWLGHQLHPDMIAEEEYVTEAQTFYRDFFGIEVSAAELLAHGG